MFYNILNIFFVMLEFLICKRSIDIESVLNKLEERKLFIIDIINEKMDFFNESKFVFVIILF